MNQPELDEYLEHLLAEKEPYIPDNGFTRRVVAALPERGLNPWARFAIICGLAVLSSALVLFVLPAGHAVILAFENIFSAIAHMKIPAYSSLVIAGLLVAGLVGMVRLESEKFNGI